MIICRPNDEWSVAKTAGMATGVNHTQEIGREVNIEDMYFYAAVLLLSQQLALASKKLFEYYVKTSMWLRRHTELGFLLTMSWRTLQLDDQMMDHYIGFLYLRDQSQ